jgi:hypothetical protein
MQIGTSGARGAAGSIGMISGYLQVVWLLYCPKMEVLGQKNNCATISEVPWMPVMDNDSSA